MKLEFDKRRAALPVFAIDFGTAFGARVVHP